MLLKLLLRRITGERKSNSPPVEDAIDQFTRHIVSEWVTDLWYSKLTPDQDGPEELVQLMNGVLGEIACRMRNINLIDLLMRDVIHMICKHLEVFRVCQAKIKKNLASLSFDQRDMELKLVLAAENKLHPLLFSAEAEHKVLQHIMDGLLSLTFKPEDLQCSFFHYVSRELLACAVIRPVLNLANPRFINERIEQVVLSMKKGSGEAATENNSSLSLQNEDTSNPSPFPDPSTSGVELVELKNIQSNGSIDKLDGNKLGSEDAFKDPLLSVDARSTRSWSSFPLGSAAAGNGQIERSASGGEWGDMLDYFSRRKTQALAPEHFENLWSKGRNYSSKDTAANHVHQNSSTRTTNAVNSSKLKQKESGLKIASVERNINLPGSNMRPQSETMYIHADNNTLTPPPLTSDEDDEEHRHISFDETDSVSSSQISSGDEDNRVTGLDTPTTKVWDGRTNRKSGVLHIRHPLEGLEGKKGRRANKGQNQRLHRQQSGRKRSRLASQKGLLWQEVERTSFLSGIGQDIHPLKPNVKDDDSSDDYDTETIGRLQSGTTASSSASSLPGTSSVNSPQTAFLGDTFFKLRCEVLGANIVTNSSKTFAVYSISVTDAESNSWSIKRRYRHFEELHRRLKEYPEYNLHLPPKHFLSIGLDVPIIQERCKLLDQYLKTLMQLPTISASIDVWDFLSIDSQTYTFSSAFSIIETFSVRHLENSASMSCVGGPKVNHLQPRRDHAEYQTSGMNHTINSTGKKPVSDYGKLLEASGGDSDNRIQSKTPSVQNLGRKGNEILGDLQQKSESFVDAADDSTFPVEWVPPNLSGPILDLVDAVFQLQEGAWIRRKAFWVAKQVLQLGMGDALDDWLVEKIQRLRRGAVVASGIKRVEQILWPDGIFITKHPNRQKPPASGSPAQSPSHNQLPDQLSSPKAENVEKVTDLQQKEADRRAKFIYELMIDNAPATVVSIVGRKEYEQCAKDLYYFLQSSVCVKQLFMDLLQLVLLYAFPELDHKFKQLHEEKQNFGEFKAT
ncbi:Sorting nexin-13 [Bienertia sinuspersici]